MAVKKDTVTEVSDLSLSELFTSGWDIQKRIESGDLVGTNEHFKSTVQNGIEQLERAQRLVNELSLFSSNEELDELATADLKYMILPALLGDLVSQVIDKGDRLVMLHKAQVYFIDYLQRCHDYAITTERPPLLMTVDEGVRSLGPTSQRKTIEQLSAERQSKITRLKAQKEIEKKLQHLSELLDAVDSGKPTDEELIREHTITLLKLWAYKSHDCLNSIGQEIQLLETFKDRDLACGAASSHPPISVCSQPMKPIVITKDMLKSKVFGAGYPSLPSMTVEEFYEQKYKQELQNQHGQTSSQRKKEDEEEQDDKEQEDDDEQLRQARAFDDYKDDHRRGWGNRKNMG